jgi:hypothetical protein
VGWSIVYNCCWSSPAQPFSGPAGLMTTFYCLRFETLPTGKTRFLYLYPPEQGAPVIPSALGSLFVASYDSQGYIGGILPRLHTGFLFSGSPSLLPSGHQKIFLQRLRCRAVKPTSLIHLEPKLRMHVNITSHSPQLHGL